MVETNISVWRRKTVGDLTSVFRFDSTEKPPTLPSTIGRYNLARYEAKRLSMPSPPIGKQSMPSQERGDRRQVP